LNLKGYFDSVLKSSLKFIVEKWCLTRTPTCPESVGQKLSTANGSRLQKTCGVISCASLFSVSLSSFEVRQKIVQCRVNV